MDVVRLSRRSALCAGIVGACLSAAISPSAAGALDLTGLAAAPANNDAGAHSNFSIHVGFSDPADQVKDLTVHLPPGLIGDPTNPVAGDPPRPCTRAELDGDDCPAATQVGTVTANVNVHVLDPLVIVPLTINGSIYNLVPQAGEPARFGIVLRPPLSDLLPAVLPKIIQQSPVRLRQSDLGLDTVLAQIPRVARTAAGDLKTDITSLDLTLRGMTSGRSFMRNPTSCRTHTVGFDATSYANPNETASGQATFTTDACNALQFTPELGVSVGAPGKTTVGSYPPMTTVVSQPGEQAGVRGVEVLLPPEVTADPAALLDPCTSAQFASHSCPARSIVGTGEAATPLLNEPLRGPVAVVEPVGPPPAGPRLGLDLQGALPTQLFGTFLFSPALGNAFDGLPDIPITRFALAFRADRLVLAASDLCASAPPEFQVNFEGYNGATVTDTVAASVGGCGGAGGRPTATVRLIKRGSADPELTVTTRAGRDAIKRFSLRLPQQLRFAGGNAFAAGASARDDGGRLPKSAIGHTSRKLMVRTAASGGTEELSARVEGRALQRTGSLPRRPRFRVAIADVDGDITRLSAPATR
jgi:hypothetical protein